MVTHPEQHARNDRIWQTMLTPLAKPGYALTAWTLAALADFLKQKTGVAVRSQYLWLLSHRMGIAFRRPKHVLKGKRDEDAHERAKRELEAIKKQMGRMRRKVVISQDETELHLYPHLVAI